MERRADMIKFMTITLTAIILTSAIVRANGAEVQLGAYRIQDPEILRIAQELLRTPDAEVKDLKVPNPHPDAQWFPEAGLGLFMHWGIHSVVGAQPSWSMIKNYPYSGPVKLNPPEKYFALAEKFAPTRWNPDKWLGTAKAAGFTYAVLTTKHHDGYALWPSAFGDFSTRQYLDGRDLLQPYVDACRKHGLKVGFYFSPRDWHYPDFPLGDVDFDYNKRGKYHTIPPEVNQERFEQFFTFTIAQMHELLTRYGKIDVLWFDGMGWPGIPDMHTKAVYKWIRSLQPGIVINERWSKIRNPDQPEEGIGFGDFSTVECREASTRPEGWWETCNLWDLGGGWGYDKSERIHSLEWTLDNLIRCRRWGGNYLPNVGPRPDGEMTSGFYERCKELQAWMERHRDSVIGTTALEDTSVANVPVTCRPGVWYLHVGPKFNRKDKIIVKTTQPVRQVYIMRSGAEVQCDTKGHTYQLDPPSGSLREVVVMVFSAESTEQNKD